MLRVLMITRSTVFSDPGGDTVQLKSTASYLKALGVQVDIKLANDKNIPYHQYDLMQLFNVIRPNDLLFHAQHGGIPFFLSTIYVDYSAYEKKSRSGFKGFIARLFNRNFIEYCKVIARAIINGERIVSLRYLVWGHKKSIRWLLTHSACLLPNSHSEMRRIETDFGVTNRYHVVPNAIDHFRFQYHDDQQERQHVICVGRIEGRKNQLNLIKALNGMPFKLFIIGKASPNHRAYERECREAAAANVEFVEQLSQDQLRAYYSSAKVHVLPSWFETTGLSSLEAAYMGCNIVVTKMGDTEEYFTHFAKYCEPDDVDSIRAVVLDAYNSTYPEGLRKRIDENFIWERTAEETLKAYQGLINKPVHS